MLNKLLRTNVHNAGTTMWPRVEFNNHHYWFRFFTTSVHTEPLTLTFNGDLSHHWAFKYFALLQYRYLIHKNVTLQTAQRVTIQTTVKTHQSYQNITTVPLCSVDKCGNKLAFIVLTAVSHICKMLKLRKTSKIASRSDKERRMIIK